MRNPMVILLKKIQTVQIKKLIGFMVD